MIAKINITDPKDIPIRWWAKNDCLKNIKEISFTPGLNIIWGKNGSGKSSVLKLIARMLHAEQGGISTITRSSIFDSIHKNKEIYKGIQISHDGQAIMFYDPSHKVGVIGGSFDDDFFEAGLNSIFEKGSSGEIVAHHVSNIFTSTRDKKRIQPEYRVNKKHVNSVWKNWLEQIQEFFKPNIELADKVTVILDEPDRSLDIPNQSIIWKSLSSPKLLERVQLIIASHSTFAVDVSGANYIEFTPNYLEECRKAVSEQNKSEIELFKHRIDERKKNEST